MDNLSISLMSLIVFTSVITLIGAEESTSDYAGLRNLEHLENLENISEQMIFPTNETGKFKILIKSKSFHFFAKVFKASS